MTEIQIKILSLLQEVDAICRQNDIEYYLEGGAVLGAIRHGGFLPWDDDSDLAMTRSNWKKFKEVFFRDKPQNRALESPEFNEMYPTNTMRYIDTTTTSIWRSLMYDVSACGVFVDIFILEDAPDDEAQMEQLKRDFIDYCEVINPFYRLSSLGDGARFRQHMERSRRLGSRRKVAEELNEKILQYHGTPSSRYLMRWGMRFQVYDKKTYGKPTYVPFEHIMLPIPERPMEYLAYQYGIDWFMIPEAEDVELHDTVLDLNTGYRTYMDAYMPLLNKQEALDISMKYKVLEMEILDPNKAYHRHIYGTTANAAACVLSRKLQKYSFDPATALSEVTPENNALFEELFGDYLLKQLNQWYLFFGVRVPIEDGVLGCVISYLLRSGRCRQAEKLILFRTEQKKPMDPTLTEAVEAYHTLVRSISLFWYGQRKEAALLLRDNADGPLAPVEKAMLMYDEAMAGDGTDLASLRERVEAHIRLWPGEDLFKAVYAIILEKQGFCKSAAMVAKEIMDASHNGMVLRMLQTEPLFEKMRSALQ